MVGPHSASVYRAGERKLDKGESTGLKLSTISGFNPA